MNMLLFLLKRYWFLVAVIGVSWFALAHPEQLAWNRPLIQQGEYWRVFTGNLAHGNLTHWVMNMMTLVVIYFIYDDRLSNWQFTILSSLLAIIGGLSILLTDYHIYLGLSGVTHGLIAYCACVDLFSDKPKSGGIVLGAIAGKLALEQYYGDDPWVSGLIGIDVAIDAHLIFAGLGVLLAALTYWQWYRPAYASNS